MVTDNGLMCAICGVKACSAEPGTKKYPAYCPILAESDLLQKVERAYVEPGQVRRLALESARTEAAGYCRSTRIEEMIDFAHRLGVERLGIAHCVGLMREAKLARDIFMAAGFQVHTVCCKVGAISKEKIGLHDEEKVRPGQYEALCSPVGQAALLDKAGTQLNVVIGLWRGPRQPVFHAFHSAGDGIGGQGSGAGPQPGRLSVHRSLLLSPFEGVDLLGIPQGQKSRLESRTCSGIAPTSLGLHTHCGLCSE